MAKSYCTIKFYSNFPINEYSNQVYYTNSNTRDNVFDGYCSNKEGVDLYKNIASPNKTSMSFRLETNYKNAMNYNYGVVIEDNKRYYFFINNITWSSNLITATFNCSVDWWQTYCYNVELKKSFVEREHVSDDTFGKHIIDEGLPIDEYIVQSSEVIDGDNDGMYFCISCSDSDNVVSASHNSQTSIGGTCRPSKYEQSSMILFSDDLTTINYYLNHMVSENKIDGIQGLYSVPKKAIPKKIQKQGYDWDTGEDDIKYIGVNNDLAEMLEWTLNKPTTIDGYTPRNNKCFTYPYCFCNITNNNGNSLYGQFELSNDKSKILFDYYFPVIEGNVSFGYLKSYDGVTKNFDKSIQGQTNIELPFVTNTFSAYMSANQNSIANQYKTIDRNETMGYVKAGVGGVMGAINTQVQGATSAVTSLLSGNIGGVISSAVNTPLQQINNLVNTGMDIAQNKLNAYNNREKIDASLKDQQSRANLSHGVYTGVGNIICGQIGFKGQLITVTKENIEMIDNYFDMFGYKVNIIKVPQFNSRPSWNYIKTSGVNIVGNIPQIALDTIKAMFDNGTTIWHNINTMYDYSKNNK